MTNVIQRRVWPWWVHYKVHILEWDKKEYVMDCSVTSESEAYNASSCCVNHALDSNNLTLALNVPLYISLIYKNLMAPLPSFMHTLSKQPQTAALHKLQRCQCRSTAEMLIHIPPQLIKGTAYVMSKSTLSSPNIRGRFAFVIWTLATKISLFWNDEQSFLLELDLFRDAWLTQPPHCTQAIAAHNQLKMAFLRGDAHHEKFPHIFPHRSNFCPAKRRKITSKTSHLLIKRLNTLEKILLYRLASTSSKLVNCSTTASISLNSPFRSRRRATKRYFT